MDTPGQSSIIGVKSSVPDEKEKQASCPKKGEIRTIANYGTRTTACFSIKYWCRRFSVICGSLAATAGAPTTSNIVFFLSANLKCSELNCIRRHT
jgi:hypothetical protein